MPADTQPPDAPIDWSQFTPVDTDTNAPVDWSQFTPVDIKPPPSETVFKALNSLIAGVAGSGANIAKAATRLEDPGALPQNFRTFKMAEDLASRNMEPTPMGSDLQFINAAGQSVGGPTGPSKFELAQQSLQAAEEARRKRLQAPGKAVTGALQGVTTSAQQLAAETPGNEHVAKAAEAIGGMLPLFAAAMLPGGEAAVPAIAGAQQAGSTGDEALKFYKSQGYTDDQAQKMADSAAAQAGLTSAALFAALPGPGKAVAEKMLGQKLAGASPLVKSAINTLAEGAQGSVFMGADTLLRDAAAKHSFRPDLTWEQAFNEAAKAALAGGLTAGAVRAAVEIPTVVREGAKLLPKTAQEVVKSQAEAPAAPPQGVSEPGGTQIPPVEPETPARALEKPITITPQPESEVSNATSVQSKTGEFHADVRELARKGQEEVPIQESGQRILDIPEKPTSEVPLNQSVSQEAVSPHIKTLSELPPGRGKEAIIAGASLDPARPQDLEALSNLRAKAEAASKTAQEAYRANPADKALFAAAMAARQRAVDLREAHEAATGMGGSADKAKTFVKDYQPPFPGGKAREGAIQSETKAAQPATEPAQAATVQPSGATKQPQFVGMGGATPGEMSPSPQTPTGIKNATVDAERATRGLPAAIQPLRKTFGAVWDQAMALIDRDPGVQDRLIAELKEKPRALQDFEDALLLHRQVDLQNEFGKAARDLAQAYDDGRTDDVAEIRARMAGWSDALLDVYDVGKKAGTETGRGLAARRMMANEDFSLASMTLQKRAAKGGEPLTEVETDQIQKLNAKIEATQKAYDDYVAQVEARISELEASRAVDQIKADAKENPETPPHVKALADRIVTALEKQADAARVRLKGKLFSLSPDVAADLSIIGASKIARGALDFARWSGEMVQEFGDAIKPHLQDLFKMSSESLDKQIERSAGKNMAPRVKKSVAKTDIEDAKKTATENISEKVSSGKKNEITPYVQKLARLFVEQGIKQRDPLVDAVHAELVKIDPEITRREAMDAISGYGDFKQLSQDQISVELRGIKGELQQVAKLEDLQAKKPLQKTGVERRTPTNEERRLIKQVNEAKKKYGVMVTDPASQLRSALDASKTRLRNQINDLQHQIDTREKIVKQRTSPPTDPEVESLKAQRDALKTQFDDIFGKKEITDEQRLKAAIAAAERSEAEWEKRLADARQGVFDAGTTGRTPPSSAELDAIRARREALKDEVDSLRDADEGIQQKKRQDQLETQKAALQKQIAEQERRLKEGDLKPTQPEQNRPAEPAIETLKQQRDALARQIVEARKKPAEQKAAEQMVRQLDALNKRIREREEKLASGNLSPENPRQSRPMSPQLEMARQRLEAVNKQIEEARKAARPRMTPEQRSLNALKTRLRNRTEELRTKLKSGDFSTKPKTPIKLDEEGLKLKAENEKAKQAFEAGLRADQLARRSRFDKIRDSLTKWRRGFLLSSPTTLAKLTAAAALRMVTTPLEEAVGGGLSKLPGVSEVAARAPREGGFSAKAESEAITKAFTQGLEDAANVLKTGKGTLETLFGDRREVSTGEMDSGTRSIVDFFGQLHGALKAPVKRAEFARSFQKRAEFAMKQGVDVTDPLVQMRLSLEAYKDADRAIFTQNNPVAEKVRRFINSFEEKNKATGKVPVMGKVAATTGRLLLPITRVPTNIVGEIFQYITGTGTGSAGVVRALRNGVENLKPEEADLIMRQLKKGSLGAAGLITGYLLADQIGGYHQTGQKPKHGDLKPGSIKIAGEEIPAHLLHSPFMETLQVGATVRKVADSKLRKKDQTTQGIPAGLVAGGLGLTEEVPFVREMLEVTKAYNPNERGAFFGELGKSMIEPQALQWIAEKTDKNEYGQRVNRKPTNVVEHLEMGIPGLREKVPVNWKQPVIQ
jgi:hypothetical protein